MTTTIYISISLLYIYIITKIRYSLRNLIRRNYIPCNKHIIITIQHIYLILPSIINLAHIWIFIPDRLFGLDATWRSQFVVFLNGPMRITAFPEIKSQKRCRQIYKKDFDWDLGLNILHFKHTGAELAGTIMSTTASIRSISPISARGIRSRSSAFTAVLPKPTKRVNAPVSSRFSIHVVAEADQPVVKIGTRGR